MFDIDAVATALLILAAIAAVLVLTRALGAGDPTDLGLLFGRPWSSPGRAAAEEEPQPWRVDLLDRRGWAPHPAAPNNLARPGAGGPRRLKDAGRSRVRGVPAPNRHAGRHGWRPVDRLLRSWTWGQRSTDGSRHARVRPTLWRRVRHAHHRPGNRRGSRRGGLRRPDHHRAAAVGIGRGPAGGATPTPSPRTFADVEWGTLDPASRCVTCDPFPIRLSFAAPPSWQGNRRPVHHLRSPTGRQQRLDTSSSTRCTRIRAITIMA